MFKRLLLTAVLACASASPAFAKSSELMLKIMVRDEAAQPLITASVRNSQEAEKHGVNGTTGAWEGSVLYLPDGTEVKFAADMPLEFEISAPGFITQKVAYQMRKRKNLIQVNLVKIPEEPADPNEEEVDVGFGRDKQIRR
jgi:hypothetical protein